MLIGIRGTRLHVDQRGPEGAPPLLFLHGGPGSGAYDFMSFQGDRLSGRLTPGFSESLLPRLGQLTPPALLIKGGHDPATSAEEIARFRAHVPGGVFRRFESAGHFVHAECPEEFTRLVSDFVLG